MWNFAGYSLKLFSVQVIPMVSVDFMCLFEPFLLIFSDFEWLKRNFSVISCDIEALLRRVNSPSVSTEYSSLLSLFYPSPRLKDKREFFSKKVDTVEWFSADVLLSCVVCLVGVVVWLWRSFCFVQFSISPDFLVEGEYYVVLTIIVTWYCVSTSNDVKVWRRILFLAKSNTWCMNLDDFLMGTRCERESRGLIKLQLPTFTDHTLSINVSNTLIPSFEAMRKRDLAWVQMFIFFK